jgi:hypothetical protein
MNPLRPGKLFNLIILITTLGCQDKSGPAIPVTSRLHCDCGLMQSALTIACDQPFALESVKIKSVRDRSNDHFKMVDIMGIQKFNDSPLTNVSLNYQFDCKGEYIIQLNEEEHLSFHIKEFHFSPQAAPNMNRLETFCDLTSFVVNDSLVANNRIYLKLH